MAYKFDLVTVLLQDSMKAELLACRRYFSYLAGPVGCHRKLDLMKDLRELCQEEKVQAVVCSFFLNNKTKQELLILGARMKKMGCKLPTPMPLKRLEVLEVLLGQSADATGARTGQGVCPGQRVVSLSSSSNDPAPLPMVAYDTTADPTKLRRRISKKWRKRAVKLVQRKLLKDKLRQITVVLEDAVRQNPTAIVGALKLQVENTLDMKLDGRTRLAFDRALLQLTAKPQKPQRRRQVFKLAKGAPRTRSKK
jgi:hypothetical protein